MIPNMEKFITWLKAAKPEERKELAYLADTSEQMFYKLQYDRAKGGRVASSELAGRLEDALAVITKRDPKRLPTVTRADISPVCAQCPHFTGCKAK